MSGETMSGETMENTHHHPETDGTAKSVADAFLSQYYDVLGNHPDLVHKFYVDSSFVTRPVSDGSVSSVTTLKAIDVLIQSLYTEGESYVDILKAEAQFSYGDGLVIFVCGLIGSEEFKKRFYQVFFLAPQQRGYYVLNDMFLYCAENDGVSVVFEKDLTFDVADELELNATKVKADDGKKTTESAVVDKEIIIEPKSTSCQKKVTTKAVNSNGQANGKVSYASIIKAPASSTSAAHSPSVASKSVVKVTQSPSPVVVVPAPNSSVAKEPSNVTAAFQSDDNNLSVSSKDYDQKDENLSISVWELPLSIKPFQLDRSFSRKFGPVKQGGIQIRNAQGKTGPICYAFIEFESASSAEAAIKASPVSIDGRLVVVKRKTNKGKNNNNGKPRRGSPHRDNNSRAQGRHRDASHDSNIAVAGHKNENGNNNNGKSNGQKLTSLPAKPEIDEDGFQTVSRNGKWKPSGN